jgi:hypothetical protein
MDRSGGHCVKQLMQHLEKEVSFYIPCRQSIPKKKFTQLKKADYFVVVPCEKVKETVDKYDHCTLCTCVEIKIMKSIINTKKEGERNEKVIEGVQTAKVYYINAWKYHTQAPFSINMQNCNLKIKSPKTLHVIHASHELSILTSLPHT